MDIITSFVLGVFTVAFISVSVIAVWALVKTFRIQKQLNELDRTVIGNFDNVCQIIEREGKERDSKLDSRLDKLETRLIEQFFQRARGSSVIK